MAEGLGPTPANSFLDDLVAAYPWIKPHVGAPGPAGTANAAAETTRKDSTGKWAAASAGSVASNAVIEWTSVAASEDWTHFTAWSASSGGTFGYSGSVVANPLVSGDTMRLAAGSLTVSVPLAS